MGKYVIGIDPGSPVFMAMIGHNGRWIAHAGDKLVSNKAKRGVLNDPDKVVKLVKDWIAFAEKRGGEVCGVVENVGPMPGEGIVSASKFVGSVWMARSIFSALNISNTMVTPQVWKRYYKLPRDKGASVKLAMALFPYRAWRLKYKKDHNYAEAALLARYHWEQLNVTGV